MKKVFLLHFLQQWMVELFACSLFGCLLFIFVLTRKKAKNPCEFQLILSNKMSPPFWEKNKKPMWISANSSHNACWPRQSGIINLQWEKTKSVENKGILAKLEIKIKIWKKWNPTKKIPEHRCVHSFDKLDPKTWVHFLGWIGF